MSREQVANRKLDEVEKYVVDKIKNVNLNNSQISDKKINSKKRDYDKEPLIIKSYERFFLAILQVLCYFFQLLFSYLFHIYFIIFLIYMR